MLTLTILGSNSAISAYGRNPTAQYLQNEFSAYLIDCGEGTQSQMSRYKVKPSKLTHIFISHMHGDHYFGLVGLLTSMGLLGRKDPLHIYAPQQLKPIIDLQFAAAGAIMPYPLYFHNLGDDREIMNDEHISVHSFKVSHRIECWGFVFRERHPKRRINPERAAIYDIPFSFYPNLQNGEDYRNAKGSIVPNEEVTFEPKKSLSYAYCGDTSFTEGFLDKVKNVDLLYHETTFLNKDAEKARQRFHSTTGEAAIVAKLAGAHRLLIGHYSSRYEVLDDFLTEVKEVFPNALLAVEGETYTITDTND